MHTFLKDLARAAATLIVLPELLSFRFRAWLFSADRALEGSSQLLALVPGIVGQYVRNAFLRRVLKQCHPTVVIEFGTIFSQTGACLEELVYIGPRCHLGLVHLEKGVLLGAGVHVPSGGHIHESEEATIPIRDQPMRRGLVRIGAGAWIGSAAVVMADVGRDSIIGAGAVVTRPIPDGVVAAGVPARVLRSRAQP